MRTRFAALATRTRTSKFVRDTSSLASGVFIAQLIGLAISPLLTRLFSPTDFGVFSLVAAVATMLGIFSTLKLEMIIPATGDRIESLHLLQILLLAGSATGLVLLVIIFPLQAKLSSLLSLPQGAEVTLIALPALLVVVALHSGIRAWCVRHGHFAVISRAQIMRAMTAATVWTGLGLSGLVATPGLSLTLGQLAGDTLFAGILYRTLSKRELMVLRALRIERLSRAFKRNLRMIRAVVSSQALAGLYGRLPILVIATVYGPAEAGYYALAERIAGAPAGLLANTIGDVYRQRAAVMHNEGRRFDGLLRQVVMLTLVVSLVPFLAVILLVPHYLGAVFGSAWQSGAFTMVVLLIGAMVGFNTTPVDKTAIIVRADRYILGWHSARLVLEGGCAIAALSALIGYEPYLIMIVAGRAALYLFDLAMMHRYASLSPAGPRN